jgi:hypothetical protein
LEGVGGKFVNAIAHLELGFAENLVGGFGGEKPGEALGLLEKEGLKVLQKVVGDLFLFGRECEIVHEKARIG